MYIKDLFLRKKAVISFEIFPPKKESNIETMYDTIEELKDLKPDFISITYGAGGTGSNKTLKLASILKNKYNIEPLAHLTCINSTKEKINSILKELQLNKIENILALRGDIPESFKSETNLDYTYGKDLITQIKGYGNFSIGAAAYPEGHINCTDLNTSIEHLKEKVDAGADFLITQLFFDNNLFYKFMDLSLKHSINIPITAGIMPLLSKNQIQKMIFMCGATLPSEIIKIINKYENDPVSLRAAGIDYAYNQIHNLISNGVNGIHIYTMNKPYIAKENMKRIQLNWGNDFAANKQTRSSKVSWL